MDLVQQSHGFFAQVQRSGVAGRRRAVRQANRAEDAQEGGESQPHVGSEAMWLGFFKFFNQRVSGLPNRGEGGLAAVLRMEVVEKKKIDDDVEARTGMRENMLGSAQEAPKSK